MIWGWNAWCTAAILKKKFDSENGQKGGDDCNDDQLINLVLPKTCNKVADT